MRSISLALVLTCVAGPCWGAAQSTVASLAGEVTDASGRVLEGAMVIVRSAANGGHTTASTGASGDYRLVALRPGDYAITVTRDGFQSVTERVSLLVGSNAIVNFSLPLAGVELTTTVTAARGVQEIARSQPASVVTQQQIDALPILDRNFLGLAQLVPGSGPVNSTVGRFSVAKFGGPSDQRSGVTTRVDGGDIDDAQWGVPAINIGQDAVQEFKVFRYQFDAEYGHALNAVVSVATRAGTNQYGGRGFYFGRDESLNARNPFASGNLPFDEQRLGGSTGGPLARDRTHYFAAYERDHVDNVRIIALPASNRLAMTENGTFPASTDNQTLAVRIDHRVGAHGLAAHYGYDDQQSSRAQLGVTSDTSQVDILNASHRLVLEDAWTSARVAHVLRAYLLRHELATVPRTSITGVVRPAGTIGQTNADSQTLSRTRAVISNALYLHTGQHDLKLGAEFAYAVHHNDSHVFENGVFRFQTDTPFDGNNAATWPISFDQQLPGVVIYNSRELAGFVQDDFRLSRKLRVNAGLRYDIDFGMRLNDEYQRLVHTPSLEGLDYFVSGDRGTDSNNLQPRVGAAWDARGDGSMLVRAGWGIYVGRNRPWFQLRSLNQFASIPVRVTDRSCLRFFPDAAAVLGAPQSDGTFACQDARQLGTVIPDDFVQPYALNTTAGLAWQVRAATSIEVDYVHSSADHQTGFTDRNLPAEGPISSTNPRPVPAFGQVLMIENYSKSWYDALEMQIRTRPWRQRSLQASYTLGRSYLDGVDFFVTTRGTQRTPHERGYNPSDQRHNLTIAGTTPLAWSFELAAIARMVSGSPMKVQAGRDLDGDTIITGDLPVDIPITVGREDVDESFAAINRFRATLGLPPIDRSLLDLDPFVSIDVRLTRSFTLGGRHRVELLVECFNATNHVNFRSPSGSPPNAGSNINSSAFLQRTVARDARQVQWGVRWLF